MIILFKNTKKDAIVLKYIQRQTKDHKSRLKNLRIKQLNRIHKAQQKTPLNEIVHYLSVSILKLAG